MIAIIDYGMGNLRSVENKFKRMGVECCITSKEKEIDFADKIILPGVGHFKYAMDKLNELQLIKILEKKVIDCQIPILGICLGTQLFCRYSEEGICQGLGWIDADVVKFALVDKIRYKVPHMGWNNVNIKNSNSLNEFLSNEDQFYFVHSYYLNCKNPKDIWMTSFYEYEFVSAIHRNNVYGTQFHPEKSHDAGYALLKKFAEL